MKVKAQNLPVQAAETEIFLFTSQHGGQSKTFNIEGWVIMASIDAMSLEVYTLQ